MEAFIRKASDDAERELERELLRKFQEMGLQSLRQDVLAALTGDQLAAVQAALDALDWASFVQDWQQVSRIIARSGRTAGFPTIEQLAEKAKRRSERLRYPQPSQVMVDMSFDIIDRNVVSYAERRAATLVVEIAEDMRNTIRTVVVQAVEGQYTADEAARMLAKVIPLHSRYAGAVMKRERNLYERFIRDGMSAGKARAKASELGTKYAAKLVRARARTIARTEIVTASSYGQYEGFRTAIGSGLLSNPASGYKVLTKEWSTAEDELVCPVCGPMDKKQVDWSENFAPNLPFPPAHPNCRCTWNIIDNMDQYDFDGNGTAEEEYADLVQRPAEVSSTLRFPV